MKNWTFDIGEVMDFLFNVLGFLVLCGFIVLALVGVGALLRFAWHYFFG